MDSLTARLMSRSGLNPVDPTLPPVHNMRVVYLNEKFGDAEEALHDARLALESVQAGGPTNALYAAMAKLEVKERDYFANRYFGRDKAVLKGWNVDWKQKLFQNKIDDLKKAGHARNVDANITGLYVDAQDAAASSETACAALDGMNKLWYDASNVRKTDTPNFAPMPQGIDDAIANIRTNLRDALAIQPSSSMKRTSVQSVRESLRDAETCQRLAHLVMNNRWDLPDDLRKKPPAPTP